jgi:2-polyprenyl-6-hydroxyphenyl methylase/3-demethylubiquinone-9 3-methyltransferase
MDNINSMNGYNWTSSKPTQAHSFLLPRIDKAFSIRHKSNTSVRIFDAGCGNGFIAGYFLKKGHEVTGCDASEKGINFARSSWPKGRFEVHSVYDNLPQKFGSNWDVVISSEVIEHLYNPRLFIQNVHELLKPGGFVIITTPYHGYLKNLVIALAGAMDRHFSVLWNGGHIKFWSYKTLKSLLSEAGFYDFKFYGAGRLPLLWKAMVVSARKAQF